MAEMAREAWTDERLDDLKGQMEMSFVEVKVEIRELRAEIRRLGSRLDRLNYTLIAALLGLLATHYLG
jgi:hypothetical protein